MKRARIGEIFIRAGLLSEAELQRVTTENRSRAGEKFGETIVRLGLANETEVARALSFQLGLPYIDLDTVVVDPLAVKRISRTIAEQRHLLPVYLEKNILVVAMDDPQDFEALEAARFASGLSIHPHIADAGKLSAAITRYYSVEESLEAIIQNISPADPVEKIMEGELSPEKLEELTSQAEAPATAKFVNTLILQALSVRASAVYIDAQEQEITIKNRIDGTFLESMRVPKWMQGALSSRLKMMAGLDFAQRFERQDGSFVFHMQQRRIDIEISCLPSQYGENILLIIQGTGGSIPSLHELTVHCPETQKALRHLLGLSKGLILACGPIGSGKTTLLYAMAQKLVQLSFKVVTVESPIEYTLKGAQQVQVNETTGLSFARASSSVLHHNPDVLFWGELRDRETAQIAIDAALETQRVITAIRSPNITEALNILKGFGLEAQRIASSLNGIISLRIVRTLCEHCREHYQPDSELVDRLQAAAGVTLSCSFFRGKGCQTCHYTGYHGMTGVQYVLTMSRGLRTFITQGLPEGKMKKALDESETAFFLEKLLGLVEAQVTTLEEIHRALLLGPRRSGDTEQAAVTQIQPTRPQKNVSPPPIRTEPPVLPPVPAETIQRLDQIAAPRTAEENGYAFQGFKILLVDDELDLSIRLKRALQDKHFQVSIAANGKEALTQIHREKPHLIITDVMMPVMDGLELIRRLRKDVTTTFIPVIILSSKHDTADRLKGFAVGTDDYLPKPFSIHELFFRINAILRRVYR